jgi:hypothetical protein
MRDVECRFTLPWCIYSLNSMASSSHQISQISQRFRNEQRMARELGMLEAA